MHRYDKLISALSGSHGIAVAIFLALILLLVLGISILFTLTLYNTAMAIEPKNRMLAPLSIWLMVVPYFNLLWQFYVIAQLSKSIGLEFYSRGLPIQNKPTYKIGMVSAILSCLYYLPGHFPALKFLLFVVGFITCIVYWVKVYEFKNRIKSLPPAHIMESQIFGNTFPQ